MGRFEQHILSLINHTLHTLFKSTVENYKKLKIHFTLQAYKFQSSTMLKSRNNWAWLLIELKEPEYSFVWDRDKS